VSHGYAVAYSDGVEFERHAACGYYAFLDGLADFLQVNVPWHDGRVAVGYAYEGFFEVFTG
jgi:hypothetical protein